MLHLNHFPGTAEPFRIAPAEPVAYIMELGDQVESPLCSETATGLEDAQLGLS